MKTLVRIVKVIGGYENWYRIEGNGTIEIEFRAEAI